jgi:AsmA protein
VKVSRLLKIFSIGFSLLLILVLAPVVFLLTLDPNDYKPQIERLAQEQGVDLQINGDLGWQIYPSIALELNEVALATDQAAMSLMASLEQAQLDIDLWPIFAGELSVSGIRVQGVDLSVTEIESAESPTGDAGASDADAPDAATSEEISVAGLSARQITLQDLHLFYQPIEGDAVDLEIAELSAGSFNLAGNPFPFAVSFDLEYAGQSLNLGMSSQLLLDLEASRYQIETERLDLGVTGDQSISSQIDLVAEVNLDTGSWSLELTNTQIDDLSARLNAEGMIEPLSATGHLSLSGGTRLIGRLANTDLLNNLALETSFDYGPESLVLDSLGATLNESDIEASLQYFLDAQQTSQLNIDIDQINIDQYLAGPEEAAEPENNENPLAFLETMPPFDIRLTVNDLTVSGYQLTELELISNISEATANVALQHAGFADGDLEAGLVLQANSQPQVSIDSLRANNLQLGQIVKTDTGEPIIEGEATAAFSGELVSLVGDTFLSGLNGDGLVSVDRLYLPNWNIEQNICVSAERLGATSALRSSWSPGTEFSSFSTPVQIRNGITTLEEITSGFGNIAFTGGGNLNLVSMDLSAQLALLIQGDRTSEQGCSINQYIRNTELPLSCEGNIGEGGEMSCGLDNAVIQALLTGRVQNAIQQRLERFLAPQEETEEENAEEVEDPTRRLFEDALRGILRPNPR